jgi:hypothetical protein
MPLTWAQAEARYREIRHLSHQKAVSLLSFDARVDMRDIDRSALESFALSWALHSGRLVTWPWNGIAADYRRKFLERFEAAIWSGDQLCGLAIGKPSNARNVMALHFLEGNPNVGHPLKGMVHVAALEAVLAYAIALQTRHLRLIDPLPAVVPLYAKFGFRLVAPRTGSAYCEMEIVG